MVRVALLVAALGALVTAGAIYCAQQLTWPPISAALSAASKTASESKPLNEEWPICTTMGALESEADLSNLDPDFVAGKTAIASQDWNGAVSALKLAALRDPRNADIHNYIGYAHRRQRQFGPAMGHYQQALAINQRHRSAHEHLGELYLVLREPAKSEEHLAALEQICLLPCSEFGDLQRAIATYYRSASR